MGVLLTSTVVTLWYRAPEVLLGTSYATPIDIWSCGCILAELYNRTPLFPGKYETDQLAKIFQIIGTPSVAEWPDKSPVLRKNFVNYNARSFIDLIPEIDPLALDLLQKMLTFDPQKRITAQAALAILILVITPPILMILQQVPQMLPTQQQLQSQICLTHH